MGNRKNAAIALLTPIPSIAFYLYFLHDYSHRGQWQASAVAMHAEVRAIWEWCAEHPLLLANALFFLNVNVVFWIIGLAQSSHWMIDLYWTVIPVMLVHYYASHPLANAAPLRSRVVTLLTWLWSVRLTHSYFRREEWQWGAREDWRFNDLRKQYGKHWWWMSFFAVYVSQQIFLIGICLPMYAVHSSNAAWDLGDYFATVICLSGIILAFFADTQLHDFVNRNKMLIELGISPEPNLDKGLWRYSRHPNYFGEQLWWWGFFMFAWNIGYGWMFSGPFVNSLCLAYVTVLVERRMLNKEYRSETYRQYQKTTSMWIPWFQYSSKEKGEKSN